MKFQPYLNFDGNAYEAFQFYNQTLQGELYHQTMGNSPGGESVAEGEKSRAMHVCITLNNGQQIMASDCLPSAGHVLTLGNNLYINLSVDSRAEADRIFNGLSEDGEIEMPMEDMFWGDYFGSFKDKYGVLWMINYNEQKKS